nr:MAG TPA: hypothetical protein [Caudoviricetes sp.]
MLAVYLTLNTLASVHVCRCQTFTRLLLFLEYCVLNYAT